jgi:integrase
MPRRAKGARLYLDPSRREWVIRDGPHFIRTGWREGDRADAEKSLGEYIGRKHRPEPSASPLIDDVLIAYGREHGPHTARPRELAQQIERLLAFWSGRRVSDVSSRACRAYAQQRASAAGARRDLETLRAALNYWHREYGPLPSIPAVVLPPKSEPRERWLTRSEAARLLWAARRTEHLKRFILIGLYTGSRSGAILALQWEWVDLERGTMRRRGAGESESNKRRPPVRLGARILSHLRRWRQVDGDRRDRVVAYEGRPVTKLRRSWAGAVRRAKLDQAVTPHTLRHTRATWLMQEGVPIWQAAGHLGMTVEMLERVYGKHHPDWQREAAEV